MTTDEEPYEVYEKSSYSSYQTPLDVVFYKRHLGLGGGTEIMVPYWLIEEMNIYFHSSRQMSQQWDYVNQVEFDVILSCVPHIRTKADFQSLLEMLYDEETFHAHDEINTVVDDYARLVQGKFLQWKGGPQTKSRCLICELHDSIPELDACLNCRNIHRAEEQRIRIHLYRARNAKTAATLTLGQWIYTLNHYHRRCAYCQERPYEVIEHYVPISQGGGTTQENCVPACRSCNSKKGKNHPEKGNT